ncbi:MAG TPA: MFS transporter [Jatrophihabitantaceae bacterium]
MTTVVPEQAPVALRRNRNFAIFWSCQSLSAAGDAMSLVALPLLVLHATGSVAQMGLLTGSSTLGYVVAGTFAGMVVDRVDRRRLMIACDSARAVLFALIPLAWLAAPQVWLLYLIVPVGAVLGMTFQVSYVTAIPRLVDPSQITAANGALQSGFASAGVGGMALGGILCSALDPPAAVAIDAATFAVSAAGIVAVRFTRSESADAPLRSWSGFLAGARFLRENPVLRSLTILLTIQLLFVLGITDAVIFHLKHDLGGSDSSVGLVLATAGLGSAIAGFTVAIARRRLGFATCWIGATAAGGLAMIGIGYAHNVVAVAAFYAVYLFAITFAGTTSMSLRQQITPDHLLGRVTSAFWTIHYAASPLGAALLTAAIQRHSTGSVLLVSGIVCVVVALAGYLTPIARQE